MKLRREFDGYDIAYGHDDFHEPWRASSPVVLLHGIAESQITWNPWVPVLTPELTVIRPDLPGFGESPVTSSHWDWTPRRYAEALAEFLDDIDIPEFHLVGAKYGGKIALKMASMLGDRVLSLSVFSAQPYALSGSNSARVAEVGVHRWAAETQRARLGSSASAEQVTFWTDELMAKADGSAVQGCIHASENSDISPGLGAISAPTLIVTTSGSELVDTEEVLRYQALIPGSEVLILPGDNYHPAVMDPQRCARMVKQHILSATRDRQV